MSIFLLYGTVGVFSYIISYVSMVIQEIEKQTLDYKTDLKLINQYMVEKKLTKSIQNRVRSAIEHLYLDKSKLSYTEQIVSLFNKMPENISDEIQNEVNISIIQERFTFFRTIFPRKLAIRQLRLSRNSLILRMRGLINWVIWKILQFT